MAAVALSQTSLYDDTALKLYLPFDNDTIDYSPNPLTLTNTNSTDTTTAMFGGHARNFTTGQYIQNATPTKLRVKGDKTVVYWLRLAAYPDGGQASTAWGLYGGGHSFFNQIASTGQNSNNLDPLSPRGVDSGVFNMSLNTWYRIAERVSGTSHSLFINKTKYNATFTSGTEGDYSSAALTIGRVDATGYQLFGILDDFAFFSRALTDAELDAHNDGTLPPQGSNMGSFFHMSV